MRPLSFLLSGASALVLLAVVPGMARADSSGPDEVLIQGRRDTLQRSPASDKTGTALEDLPNSVQVIGRDLIDQQGGLDLVDTIKDSSGIGQGGSDSFGFDDKFVIRGLDARIYDDGFSFGDQRNGIPHSLNGVQRIEILKGPGSALFGSGPPGGTINIVHYQPSDAFGYGGRFEAGSFGLYSGSAYVTGNTGVQGLDFRIDGLAQHENGYRQLQSGDYEIRPEVSWAIDDHRLTLSVDARALQATPDPAGLIYVKGQPITGVSPETKYSTPFSKGDQSLELVTLADVWTPAPYVTVTNRFSYMHRDLDILRNGDGGTVTGTALTGRQLRKQHDLSDDFDYQLEPVWTFSTYGIGHTLLTGIEIQRQQLFSDRATADLPNIANIYDPVIPETSPASLNFLRDAKHSGFVDNLNATYASLYATDQVDLTERLKLRVGARQDWWNTDLTPNLFIPGRLQPDGQLFEPGVTTSRTDTPVSWNAGLLYKATSWLSPYFGVAESHLATFSSETTQTGVAAPESALQFEGGVKMSAFDDHAVLTMAGFHVKRNHVFSLVGDVAFFNDQETEGGEADLDLQLTPQWRTVANVTIQHSVLTDNPSSPASTGKIPVGVPAGMAHLWTSYDFALGDLQGFRIGGGVNYRGKMYGSTLNTNSIPGYVTGDAVLSWNSGPLTLSMGARNLGDATYFIAANGAGAFVGDPRTFFGSIAWRL